MENQEKDHMFHFNHKNSNQQWLYTHASEPSPRQIRSKPTLTANLLARCIACRSAPSRNKKNQTRIFPRKATLEI
jgi:hypothetical protein